MSFFKRLFGIQDQPEPEFLTITPQYLNCAFHSGVLEVERADSGDFSLSQQHIGTLQLPTGKLVACDPLMAFELQPFTETFREGAYPVVLTIANRYGDERVAFARVQFAEREPTSWRMLTTEGQDISTLKPTEFFGYGVDAGLGAFLDASGAEALKHKDEAFEEVIFSGLRQNHKSTRDWTIVDLPGTGANLAVFSSGWGDGMYGTWLASDDHGPIAAVTEFGVFELPGQPRGPK